MAARLRDGRRAAKRKKLRGKVLPVSRRQGGDTAWLWK
jgi:hypothetical protein